MRVSGAVSLIVFGASVASCGDLCGNEEVLSVVSPSGKVRAVAFTRSCGATTDFTTQVSLVGVGESLPNEVGNVFIVKGKLPLSLRWLSEQSLHISGVGSGAASKQETTARGVSVSYAANAP